MAVIQLRDVTKRYPDGTEAVKRMQLEIGDGEFMILVGPSGCGKSTALRMIAGLEDISDGEIFFGDRCVNKLAPSDRDIAMVFQNYALYPHMTVRQNMSFALRLAKVGRGEIARRVNEAAEILGLTDHLERKPANLSGGQRQRVAMGRAIVRDPAVFLMDEPLSNLDAKLRVQMRAEIARLQQRLGATTIYVTHDQTEAMTLGDRVAVMRLGVIQQLGSPHDLYADPANLFVAGFIGSPAMNFMTAHVRDGMVRLPVVDVPVPAELRPQLPDGREVIAGIRPEHLEDAALVSGERRGRGIVFRATVDLVESMGAEVYAHFDVGEAPVESTELREIAEDAGTSDVQPDSGAGGRAVARLGADTRVRAGDSADLWLETAKLRFFDPGSGQALRAPGVAAAIPA